MSRHALVALCASLLAALTGCGDVPQSATATSSATDAPPPLQTITFTGVAEPAAGRLQVFVTPPGAAAFAAPQALTVVPEDGNGNPATATPGTAQVYGSNVLFLSSPTSYPAACSKKAPMVMVADVDILSGFTEQLRYLYARVTSMSAGPSFCSKDSAGTSGATLNPNVGLYAYQPLDAGTAATSAVHRSVTWSLNLADGSPYWFKGELQAQVIPQLPTSINPADKAAYVTGDPTADVQFDWIEDTAANGTTDAGQVVARPTGAGSQIAILRCGPASAAFDAASCTTTQVAPTVTTAKAYALKAPVGYWYQWTLRAAFRLPGSTATTIGSQVVTRTFKTSH